MCVKKRHFKLILFGVLFCVSVSYFAQSQPVIDSLMKAIKESDGNKKTSLLIDLAVEYAGNDIDNALNFLDDAYQRSLNSGDSTNIVRSGWIQSELWRRKELLDEAMNRLQFILPVAERNRFRKDQKRILNTLAVISTYKANYDLALSYNFKSLNLREQDGDRAGMSIAYSNIGVNYFKLSNYDLALKFYDEALRLKRELNDKYDIEGLLINLGLCYNKIGEYKKANDFFLQSLSLCDIDCNPAVKIEAEHGLGLSLFGLRKFDEASIHFEKSLKKAIENGDRRNQIESLIGLAKVSFEKEDFQKSKESLDKALLAAGKTSYKNLLISIYQQYAVLADNDKDFEKASNFRKLYIQLRDSVYSESMIKNLATIQTNYVEKENLATIEANKLVIEQQKTIGVAVIIIGALLLLIALVFYHQKAQIRKVNKNLNDRIDEATKEIFESHEKLKKAVFERDYFMYKTSHDIKGPLATFLGLCMIAKLDVKDAPALEHVARIEKTAVKLNSILNRLLNVEKINLNDVEYTFVDFHKMVEDIISLEKQNLPSERISISYEIEPNLIVKSDSFLIHLIVENLISNSIKFYNNSTRAFPYVKIAIFGREDKVVIKVDDNGIGILPEMEPTIFKLFGRGSDRSETGGVGLYTAKQAAEKLEGTIGFKSERELTTFEAVLPMDMGPILRKQRDLENKLEERRKKENKPQTKDLSLVFW